MKKSARFKKSSIRDCNFYKTKMSTVFEGIKSFDRETHQKHFLRSQNQTFHSLKVQEVTSTRGKEWSWHYHPKSSISQMPSNTASATSAKHKRGGSSKKAKGSNSNATSKKEKRSNAAAAQKKESSLSKGLLFRVLMCWFLLGIGGIILYLNKDPSQAVSLAREKKIKEQQQKLSFAADVTDVDRQAKAKAKISETPHFTVDEQQIWDPPDPRIEELVSQACEQPSVYCHESLKVVGRSLRATEPIQPSTKLFEIPRSMQIWDLDAYRDPFIRKHLFKASHKISGNRMGSEAFLAAYLALQIKQAEMNPSNFDPLRLAYLRSLPTIEDFLNYHPILFDKDQVISALGPRSMAHSVLQGYRNMVKSEYDGFGVASAEFLNTISKDEYLRARLAVLTRKLNVGVPGPEEVMPAFFVGDEFQNEDLFLDELYSYYDLIKVNLTEAGGQGCIAMVPIADLFNHHPNNNVALRYKKMQTDLNTQQKTGRSFIVSSANREIEAYSEPMVSQK